MVDIGNLVHAGNGAVGGAGFLRKEFTLHILAAIFRQRRAGPAPLLGTIMNQSVLADVDIPRTGTTAPIVWLAFDDRFLKVIEAGVMFFAQVLHFVINPALFAAQGLELTVAIVDDADGGGKAQFQCATRDGQRILRILDAATDDGIDVDMKIGVLGEHLQFLVEHFETLFRHFIRLDVVDGDLHVVKTGAIEALDAIGHQQIAIGNHTGDAAMMPDPSDDLLQFRMQQGLATRNGNDAGAEAGQIINSAKHFRQGNRFGDIVELVAIGAGEVATPHGHDVRHVGMARRGQGMTNRGQFANPAGRRLDAAGSDRRDKVEERSVISIH